MRAPVPTSRRARRRRALIASAMILLLTPAAAAGEWTERTPFPGLDSFGPDSDQVAVTGAGTLVLGTNGRIFRKAPGASAFDDGVAFGPAAVYEPRVFGTEDGSVVGWWLEAFAGIRAAELSPAGVLSSTDVLDSPDPVNYYRNLNRATAAAAAANGAAVFVSFASQYDSEPGAARAAVRQPGGTLGPALEIESNVRLTPAVAVNTDGRAIVAWIDGRRTYIAVYDPDTRTWTRPGRDEAGFGFMEIPQVAMNARGDALIAWENSSRVILETLDVDATKTTLRVVPDATKLSRPAAVAVEPDGALTAVMEARSLDDRWVRTVWSRRPDRTWAATTSAATRTNSREAATELSDRGDVVVAWVGDDGLARAQVRRPGRGFGAVQDLGPVPDRYLAVAAEGGDAVVFDMPRCPGGDVRAFRLLGSASLFSPGQTLEAGDGSSATDCDTYLKPNPRSSIDVRGGQVGVIWQRAREVKVATSGPGDAGFAVEDLGSGPVPTQPIVVQVGPGGGGAAYVDRTVSIRQGVQPTPLPPRDASGPPMDPVDPPPAPLTVERDGDMATVTCHDGPCAGLLLAYRRGWWFPSRVEFYVLRDGASRTFSVRGATRVVVADAKFGTVTAGP